MDLQPNTIKFFVSNLSLENENQSEILWIYSHLKYSQSCIDNNQCKEYFHSKLITSFTKLSDFLTTIELNYYNDKQIQLNWCSLIGKYIYIYISMEIFVFVFQKKQKIQQERY